MKIDIGVVRISPQIDDLTEALLKTCYEKQISACTYLLTELCTDTATAPALVWDGAQYCQCTVSVPPISECRFSPDSNPRAKRLCPEKLEWLRAHTFVTDGDGLLKSELMQCILASEHYAYAIPTYPVHSYREALFYTSLLKRCILKPSGGRKGLCVISLLGRNGQAVVFDGKTEQPFDEEYWKAYRVELSAQSLGAPILQPRLNFTLDDARALDFRIWTIKGGSGSWEIAKISACIGGNPLISNIAHGGELADASEVLKELSAENAARFTEEFGRIAVEIPRLIEAQKSKQLSCFGIDVGIDRDTMQVYVIEANTMPGAGFYAMELADKKTDYYRYLLQSGIPE